MQNILFSYFHAKDNVQDISLIYAGFRLPMALVFFLFLNGYFQAR